MKKIKLALVFGGKSGEHEVSIASARSIYQNLDKEKYDVTLAGIDKTGNWHVLGKEWLIGAGISRLALPEECGKEIIPAELKESQEIEVFFPIIHGTYGEDGCLQGMFELLNVPYVGAGVLGSAIGMDKDVQKRLLMQAGIKVAKYEVVKSFDFAQDLPKRFAFPLFVKPANMGSSVGVSKVDRLQELEKSLSEAFKYDTKVIIEEFVEGREIEVAVLEGKASIPGEVIPKGHVFYDYEAKYVDENGAELRIPAKITKEQFTKIQTTAEKVFSVLECEGMARVDMFLSAKGEIVVNEINTLPGFTSISMYPKLWEATGIPYSKLLDKLINAAIKRKKGRDTLLRSYS